VDERLQKKVGTVQKTYQEINEKIRKGQAVVLTAEGMVGLVKKKGPAQAAKEVDVVTTAPFLPCALPEPSSILVTLILP